jgi:putative phage-type endonuclease
MPTKTYDDRAAWYADFCSQGPDYSLGGSSIAAIVGISPWSTPWDIWARAHGEAKADQQTAIQARGHRWEPWLIDRYAEITGATVDVTLRRCWSGERPWLRCSPDGLVAGGIVEVKTSARAHGWGEDTTQVLTWDTEGARQIPPHYAVQAMAELAAIPEAGWVDFVVGIPDPQELVDVRVLRLARDQKTIDRILAYVEAWRERHLVLGEPPAPDTSNEFLAWAATLERASKPIEASPEQAAAVLEFARIKSQIKELETRERELQTELIAASAGSVGLRTVGEDGKKLVARVVTTAGRESISLAKLRDYDTGLVDVLRSAGVVSTGRKSAHVRIY